MPLQVFSLACALSQIPLQVFSRACALSPPDLRALPDAQGLALRIEHTHCFSAHGHGGHYHHDTTPATVRYTGYFVLAETLFRIDAPRT